MSSAVFSKVPVQVSALVHYEFVVFVISSSLSPLSHDSLCSNSMAEPTSPFTARAIAAHTARDVREASLEVSKIYRVPNTDGTVSTEELLEIIKSNRKFVLPPTITQLDLCSM